MFRSASKGRISTKQEARRRECEPATWRTRKVAPLRYARQISVGCLSTSFPDSQRSSKRAGSALG